MTKLFKKTVAVLLLLSSSCGLVAQQQQMPTVPLDPAARVGTLPNGMTYYIRRNAQTAQRADFYIAQKVGSILEEDSQRGLAHFLEHMAFNGTKNFPGTEKGLGIIPWCESIGVKFGANLNAYTSIDETVYNITNAPVIREGIVDSCLLVLHDWSNSLLLTDEEIDKERGVIHEEWRTSQSAIMRMYEKALPTVYGNNIYGHRLPIGLMEVVDHFPYQVLRDYYHKWYRPDLQGIVIVGDINVDEIENKIKKLFSDIPAPVNPAERVYFPVEDNDEPIVTIAQDKEQNNVQILLFNKHEAMPNEAKNSLNYMVLNFANEMISSMLGARLNELTQSATAPFLYASAYDGDFFLSKTKGAFTGIAISKEDGIEVALASLVREMERARKFGFTDSEYARAKAEYLRGLESAFNEKEKQKNETYAEQYVRHFIDNEPATGIDYEYATMNQIAPNIPVQAINQAMQQLITDKNLVLAVFGPEKEGLVYPSEAALLKVISDAKAEEIAAYEDKVSDEPLLAEKPKGGSIVSEKEGEFGTTELVLSNGVKVILKNTDFKADEIRMKGFSLGGSSLMPEADVLNIEAMDDVVELGGLGSFSAVDLPKILAGKKVGVAPAIGYHTENINGSCSPKDFETLMQLTYLYFTDVRVDEDAFTSYKNRVKAALLNQETNPMSTFSDSIQMALYSGHPRTTSIKANTVDLIDYQRTLELYKERFADASDFTFMFVGAIDLDTLKPFIEQYLGGLPAINRKETFKDMKLELRKGLYENEFKREMETEKSSIFVLYSGECENNLENSIHMSMISQILNLVYTEEIREKEGGTYGVGVHGKLTRTPAENCLLQIVFDTDPTKRERMVEIVLAVVEKLAKEGPSQKNLDKVKEYMLKKHAENIKENGYWLGMIDELQFGKDDMHTKYEKFVNEATTKSLQKFAKKLIKQKNRTEVIMEAN